MKPMHLNTISPIPTTFTSATLATQSDRTRISNRPLLSYPAEWGVYPLMSLPPSNLASDFQSNGPTKCGSLSCPAGFAPSLTGLGIHFIEQSGSYAESDPKGPAFPFNFSTTRDHFNACGEHISLSQISDISHSKSPVVDLHVGARVRTSPSVAEDFYPDDCNVVYPASNLDASWSFSSLSAVTTCSSDRSIEEDFLSLSPAAGTSGLVYPDLSYDLFNPPMAITPPMAGPFVDINMFSLRFSGLEQSAYVNPADTVGVGLYMQDLQDDDPDSPFPRSSSSLSGSSSHMDAMSTEIIDTIVSVLTATAVKEEELQEPRVARPLQVIGPPDNVLKTENSWESFVRYDEPRAFKARRIPSPTVSTPTSSPFASPHKQTALRRPKNATRSYVKKEPVPEGVYHAVHTLPGSPVLDAHRGIELMELTAKAEKYRVRNPGQDLSKKWLASFAGKLSPIGELLDDFRCYVVGCSQKNKRRDHILIHVGSHVDQRPFPCGFCSMRFLRKNEWKRHEAGHTGEKPFLCNICHSHKGFVRRDLLSQHMKRTHGIDSSANKENGLRPHKKAKLQDDDDY